MDSRYGFLGIGQFGGNITKKFEAAGCPCLIANSSVEDLSTRDAKNKLHFKGGEGCHKDRKKSKQLLQDNLDVFIDEVRSKLSQCTTIFVCASAAGGTGSGMLAAVAKILSSQLGVNICVVTVLPDDREKFQSYANTVELFNELGRLDTIGATFVLDNARNKDRMRINEIFFRHLSAFLVNNNGSDYGCLDRSEVDNLLATPGMAVLSRLGRESSARFVETLSNGIYAPIEQDRVIKYIGITSCDNDVEIDDIYSRFGSPIDVYIGTNARTNICMLAGLSLCTTRLNQIKEMAQTNAEILQKGFNASKSSNIFDDLSFINAFDEVKNPPKPQEKKSSFDILGEFL